MVGTASSQAPYYNIISFERIPTDQTTIVQTTNNYTNPPLTSLSKITINKLANNTYQTVNLFSNATTPQFYLRVTSGLLNYVSDPAGKISFVFAGAPVTEYSYF